MNESDRDKIILQLTAAVVNNEITLNSHCHVIKKELVEINERIERVWSDYVNLIPYLEAQFKFLRGLIYLMLFWSVSCLAIFLFVIYEG